MKLSEAMRTVTEGWISDLPTGWQVVLDGTEPDSGAIAEELELEPWEPVFPPRKGRIFPGAPEGAHMLRAFDGVAPDQVRVVFLGQDPYPEPAAATGRAFEIGNALVWRDLDRMFSRSIRAYTQMLCAARLGRPELARSFADWPGLLDEIEAGAVALDAPGDLAGRLEGQGVLLLNASLTLTRFRRDIDPHQSRGHVPFWAPLIRTVLRHLAARDCPTVFVGFGEVAEKALAEVGLHPAQGDLPAQGPHLTLILPHPAYADAFLSHPNPFLAANAHFRAAGVPEIDW